MAYYIISYDLHNQRAYQPVWRQLESWGATRLLESLWVLTSSASAASLRDGLLKVIDNDDSVAVLELKPGSLWATHRAKPDGITWLQQNIMA